MHRCFIEKERWDNKTIVPSTEEAHHIRHVLRAKDGEPIAVFNGTGNEARTILQSNEVHPTQLDVQQVLTAPGRTFEITLIQAILKGNRMDFLIEKATELGVTRIVPVMTSRVISRLDAAQGRQKRDRWERIAISAAKQCGTRWLPIIETVTSLEEAMQAGSAADAVLLASLTEQTRPLGTLMDDMRSNAPKSIAIIIGPEGDLSPDETQCALRKGAIPISLGDLTLRAETAAIYAISALACTFLWKTPDGAPVRHRDQTNASTRLGS